jgi:hypothetical protein
VREATNDKNLCPILSFSVSLPNQTLLLENISLSRNHKQLRLSDENNYRTLYFNFTDKMGHVMYIATPEYKKEGHYHPLFLLCNSNELFIYRCGFNRILEISHQFVRCTIDLILDANRKSNFVATDSRCQRATAKETRAAKSRNRIKKGV